MPKEGSSRPLGRDMGQEGWLEAKQAVGEIPVSPQNVSVSVFLLCSVTWQQPMGSSASILAE